MAELKHRAELQVVRRAIVDQLTEIHRLQETLASRMVELDRLTSEAERLEALVGQPRVIQVSLDEVIPEKQK